MVYNFYVFLLNIHHESYIPQFSEVKDCLIYCDIPYKDTKQYGTSKDFNYEDFWQWARDMSKNNIVVISEQQAPIDFKCIWQQEVIRTQDNRKRDKSIEGMFMYETN